MAKRKSTGESRQQRRQRLVGDPVDRAVVATARKAGVTTGAVRRAVGDAQRAVLGTPTQRKRGKGPLTQSVRVTKRTARRAAQVTRQAARTVPRTAKRPLRAVTRRSARSKKR